MRRVFVALIGVVVLQLGVPGPAHAWWEILEQFSGPGRWKGFDIDARLFCLVDSLPPDTKKDLVGRMQDFVARMQKAESRPRMQISPQIPPEGQRGAFLTAARDEVRKWTAALDEGERILDQWQLYSGHVGDRTAVLRLAYTNARRRADASLAAVIAATDAWINERASRADVDAAVKEAEQDAARAIDDLQRTADSIQHVVDRTRMSAAALPGVIYSACRLQRDERRRASFDVGMRFLWTHDDRYVDGERITFTTIEPAFAWNVFDNPKRDFLEYGVGAGFYWIASKAFPSVTGGFLEPVRFDFHVPTNFAREDAPLSKKIVRSLVFRFGYLVFPGGFEPDAFLADPLDPVAHRRIGRDWVRYYGIYVDTEVFRKKT
jgi:hypothetical protein